MKKIYLILIAICYTSFLYAQTKSDSISLKISATAIAGSEGYAPFWMVNNKDGIFDPYENNWVIQPSFGYEKKLGKRISITSELNVAIKAPVDETLINRLNTTVSYGTFSIMAGWKPFSSGQHSDLSSGSFIMSRNARPIPRIGAGFYNYTNVPFTKGYLKFKAYMSHGWLEEDRPYSTAKSPYMHEKSFYVKTGNLPVNVFAGLNHIALYGGHLSDGTEIGIDFISTIMAKGSDASIFQGENTNVIGGHMGLYDFGFEFKAQQYNVKFYYQRPFTDGSGFDLLGQNKDFYAGVVLKTDEKQIIQEFTFEFIKTDNQSGEGTPDPYVDGAIRFPYNADDRAFLEEYYTNLGYDVSDVNTEEEWTAFLIKYNNHGYKYGGRDDYYNNTIYRYVYNDRVIGSPLFYTTPQVEHWSDQEISTSYVSNTRMKGVHLGVRGFLSDLFQYEMLMTWTENYGEWTKYGSRYLWEGEATDPDYDWFWKGGKQQFFSYLGVTSSPLSNKSWEFQLGIGWDHGDLTNNFGVQTSIHYTIF